MAVQSLARLQRAYPIPGEQLTDLMRNIGSSRLVGNKLLEYYELAKSHGCYLNTHDMITLLAALKRDPQYAFLNDVISVVLQQAARDRGKSIENFYKGQTDFPKYKKRGRDRDSARYQTNAFSFEQHEDGTATIKLAKHKEPLVIVWDRPLPKNAKPTNVTISRHPSGQWHISIAFRAQVKKLRKRKNMIGIDMGIANNTVDSNGNKTPSLRPFQDLERHIAALDKVVARKQPRSKNRVKAQQKIAKKHLKVANIRKDWQHKFSTQLVRDNQTIIAETLAVKQLIEEGHLGKAISDAGWSTTLGMIEYKALWYGREFIKIDRFFPSTKMCSECKVVNNNLSLRDREWDCPACLAHHDRDVNAAINILNEGKRMIAERKENNKKVTAGLAGIVCEANTGGTTGSVSDVIETAIAPTFVSETSHGNMRKEAENIGCEPRDRRL